MRPKPIVHCQREKGKGRNKDRFAYSRGFDTIPIDALFLRIL
jgi:hypothetical protein